MASKPSTLSERMHALKSELGRSQWEEKDSRRWLREFMRQVELLSPAILAGGASATPALEIICWHLGQLVMDSRTSAHEGLLTEGDAQQVNLYARRILELFQVFGQGGQAFPCVQEGEKNDRLFVPEFWPPYWEWARTEFFRLDEAVAV